MGRLLFSVEVIPHSEQRYETCGDWIFEDGVLKIKVSDTGNDMDAFLVGVHEAVEGMLCKVHGVDEIDVTHFDMVEFQGDGEPGEDMKAPYHFEHAVAEVVERIVAAAAKVAWRALALLQLEIEAAKAYSERPTGLKPVRFIY